MDSLNGVPELIATSVFSDPRGLFSKSFSKNYPGFDKFNPQEQFWSVSKKDTIRGMHISTGPKLQTKIVWISMGKVLDVVTDLRPGADFGRNFIFELHPESGVLMIPEGFAHGFLALEENTVTNYLVDSTYDPHFDTGVKFSSIGFEWPITDPIISARDRNLPELSEFRLFGPV
jgi:dTDP-4-dehydrorhamnose 3,5-epimerase